MYTEANHKAHKKYMAKFALVRARIPMELQEAIKAHAEANSESVNTFLLRAIRNELDHERKI